MATAIFAKQHVAQSSGSVWQNGYCIESVGVAGHAEPSFREGRDVGKLRVGIEKTE